MNVAVSEGENPCLARDAEISVNISRNGLQTEEVISIRSPLCAPSRNILRNLVESFRRSDSLIKSGRAVAAPSCFLIQSSNSSDSKRLTMPDIRLPPLVIGLLLLITTQRDTPVTDDRELLPLHPHTGPCRAEMPYDELHEGRIVRCRFGER